MSLSATTPFSADSPQRSQFVRIGAYAMVGGAAGVLQDVPPFVMAHLNPAKAAGLNLVGLRRAGFIR